MPTAERNHVIDLARALSVLVVVVFHSLLYQVRIVDGHPALIPWAPHHGLWLLTWPFMIIPVFFIAGGYAHAVIVDKAVAQGTSYAHFLANRGRRLIGPLTVFITTISLVSTAAAWTGTLEAASNLTRQLMQLLWFISVYLVIVGTAPAAVRAHDRWGWRPVWLVAALIALVDAASFTTGIYQIRNANLLLVWPLVHQLGIAYHRGWLRRGPLWRPVAALLGGVLGICVLVFGFGYPGTSVGFADLPIANVLPPTLAMVFLGVAQCGVLALVERSGRLAAPAPWLLTSVAGLNALMMSVYLWHIGCIALAAGALFTLSEFVPLLAGVLLAQGTVAAITLVVVAGVVPQIARLEFKMIAPLGAAQGTKEAVIAYSTLALGTALVWQAGTVIHPARPWSSLGVGLVWLGIVLMRRAANHPRGFGGWRLNWLPWPWRAGRR